jgi:hypothetical protein
MAQMDDSIGELLNHLQEIGEADNTIVIFATDNGAEVFTWPDGGMTPFRATKGTVFEGGFRVPAIIRWPGKVKAGAVENGIFSGLDWLPTLAAAAGNPDIKDQLLKGVKLGDRTYKNHLDGYNQLDLLLGKGPSARHELFYFGGPALGAIRIDDFKFQFYQQPYGWPGEKVTTDMPLIYNIRQDPFERTPSIRGESLNNLGGGYMNDFYAREFWRFVLVQQKVADLANTAIDFPPMQNARLLQPGGREGDDQRGDEEPRRAIAAAGSSTCIQVGRPRSRAPDLFCQTRRREAAMIARVISRVSCAVSILAFCATAWAVRAADDPLASWNDGVAKTAIVKFVEAVTTPGGADFVPAADRIATFDQDGTLWVEHPVYTQAMFALDRYTNWRPSIPIGRRRSRSRRCSLATVRRWLSSARAIGPRSSARLTPV